MTYLKKEKTENCKQHKERKKNNAKAFLIKRNSVRQQCPFTMFECYDTLSLEGNYFQMSERTRVLRRPCCDFKAQPHCQCPDGVILVLFLHQKLCGQS